MSAFRMKRWSSDRIAKLFDELAESPGGEIYDVKREEKYAKLRCAAVTLFDDLATEEAVAEAIDYFLPRMNSYSSVYCTATMQGRGSVLFGIAKDILAKAVEGVKEIFAKHGVKAEDHEEDDRVKDLKAWWEAEQHDSFTQKRINSCLSDLHDLRKADLQEEYRREFDSAFPNGAITL